MKPGNTDKNVSSFKIFGYALGDGAVSITMNGIASFALLYYTQVLGLNPAYAGVALSVALLWDAVTDPVMGYITDNTRSRFGRRLPYMTFGGLALAVAFFFLWFIPAQFTSTAGIFTAVLLTNILLRTVSTVFIIPYMALGFEICPDYVDRSRLQGARSFINQITNFLFGALAWILFFKDEITSNGARIDGALIGENYIMMGTALAVAIVLIITTCVFNTRRYAKDNRNEPMQKDGRGIWSFFKEIGAVFQDRLSWYVFGFMGIGLLGIFLTSQTQMFTFVCYMKLTAVEKTCVHGFGMITFALMSLTLPFFVKRFDKKRAAYLGMGISAFGTLSLLVVFSGGLLKPQTMLMIGKASIPIATIVFGGLFSLWWAGCGLIIPLANSMIADVSEIHQRKTGILKDGEYASVLSFFMKAASSIGMLLTGQLLMLAGIVSGAESQTVEASKNISMMTFLCGPVLLLGAFLVIRKYPVDRKFMHECRESGRTS